MKDQNELNEHISQIVNPLTFTSVSLVLKMAQKQLWPDRNNRTPAKKKKIPLTASSKKTPPPTMPKKSKTAHHGTQPRKINTLISLQQIK